MLHLHLTVFNSFGDKIVVDVGIYSLLAARHARIVLEKGRDFVVLQDHARFDRVALPEEVLGPQCLADEVVYGYLI